MLSGLRQMIDQSIHIRVGGGAFNNGAIMPEGVERLKHLYAVELALAEWKR